MQLQRGESTIDAYAETPSKATRTVSKLRCSTCGKLLAELVTTPFRIRCRYCKNYTEE